MFWLIIVVLLTIAFIYKITKGRNYWKERNVPYLKPWPLFGEIYPVVFRILSMPLNIQRLYNAVGNNRYLGVHQFLRPTIILKDPELIKQVTVKYFDHFMDHRRIVSGEDDPLFGRNLLTLTGQEWREMRTTLSPSFTSSKMRSMFPFIIECADQFAQSFLKKEGEILSVEMKNIFTRYTTDVIATTAFGLKCNSIDDEDNEFYLTAKETTDLTGLQAFKFFGFALSPLLMKLLKIKVIPDKLGNFFRNIIKETIEMREKNGIIRPDMLHLLMETRKGKLKQDDSEYIDFDEGFASVKEYDLKKSEEQRNVDWSDDDLVAQALVFFLGGFDTSSTLMCYTAYELALNVDIQEKLQKEIDETLKASNGKLTYETVLKMKYLDMVISESLRKWPPFAVTDRICVKDYTVEPMNENETAVVLEKGVVMLIPIYGLHRDPENYPNPEKFDPERFTDENKHNIKPFTYLPFGVGPRGCIGSRFALLEVKVVILSLLSKFDIVVTEKTQIPIKLSKSHFNMSPEKGFWLGFKKRVK